MRRPELDVIRKRVFVILIMAMSLIFGMTVHATQSRSENFSKSYSITNDGATDICNIALAQYMKTGSMLGYTEAWCADFIADCAKLAGQASAIPANGVVSGLANNIKSAGGSVVSSPKKGDIAIISWDNSNSYMHAEIVYDVQGAKTYTIGGNSGRNTSSVYVSEVAKHTWPQSVGHVVCYIRPNYHSQLFFDFWNFNNDTLSGSPKIWWKETGYGNCDVNLSLDGKALGTIYPDSSGYFSYVLDTTKYSNGKHNFSAIIRSTSGAQKTVQRTITINNPKLIKYIGFSSDNINLSCGNSMTITVTTDPVNPDEKLTLYSYDDSVVYSEFDGNKLKIIGISEGTTDVLLCASKSMLFSSVTVNVTHRYTTVETKKATCGTEGVGYEKCSWCGYIKPGSQKIIPATNKHNYRQKSITVSRVNCEETTYTTYECSVCKKTYKETSNKKESHSYVKQISRKRTCSSAGIQVDKCTRCGKVKEGSQKTIPATNKHNFGNWEITKSASALEKGCEQRICSVCGKKEIVAISKLPATIRLTSSQITLKVKQSTTKVKISGLAYGDYVKSWVSNNTKIVKVNNKGKITAQKKTGNAVITVTLASGKQAKIRVKVQKGAVAASKITGVSKKLTLKRGESYILKPVISPITCIQKITYKTSNKGVATVSSKGKIVAKKKGRAIITVTCGKKKIKCNVTVQ